MNVYLCEIFDNGFAVKHYAGDVTYSVEAFAVKNKDSLFISLVLACQTSSIPFVKVLFPEDVSDDMRAPPTSGKCYDNKHVILLTHVTVMGYCMCEIDVFVCVCVCALQALTSVPPPTR
jgi:myosin heavy subunit